MKIKIGAKIVHTAIWIPHPEKGWCPGVVISQNGDKVLVKVDNAEDEFVITSDKIFLLDKQALEIDYDDMVKIDDLNEPILLHNLKQRFTQNKIYTLIGSVLVSLNPFKDLGLYSNEKIGLYKGRDFGELPPHIYQIATSAYQNLIRTQKSQAILVSGESGSGKTESAKSILSCLAHISSQSNGLGKIEEMILESNPVLEAFGNARTVRNNNSSRFGKFIQIHFDKKGKIIGANVDTYLLEKSRIVFQALNERNYHIFYQLLSGSTKEEKQILQLYDNNVPLEPKDFFYLKQSECYVIPNVNDKQHFLIVKDALKVIGLSDEQQLNIFKMLAAILHLGNIQFAKKPQEARKNEDSLILEVANTQHLFLIAEFLGCNANSLEQTLLTRNFRGASRGSVYAIPLDLEQAIEGRDALAKAIYERIFFWLVEKINDHLSSGSKELVKEKVVEKPAPPPVATPPPRTSTVTRGRGGANAAGAVHNNNNPPPMTRRGTLSNVDRPDLKSLMVETQNHGIIGVLDIFGFEIFEINSLEQLMINFANEKLQCQFNRMMFQVEKEEYEKEGVILKDEIKFTDNQLCVDLIEKKPFGVLPLLDEECQMPKGSEAKLLEKLLAKHALNSGAGSGPSRRVSMSVPAMNNNNNNHINANNVNTSLLEANRKDSNSFIISHYAGKVTYSVINFLEKNRDTLHSDLETLMEGSSNAFIARELFATGSSSSARKRSVSMSFILQLSSLIQTLEEMNSHYVRCIKPNPESKSDIVDDLHTLHQLRCAGLLDTIRVRKLGFSYRKSFQQFVDRFACLVPLSSLSKLPKGKKDDRAECLFYMKEFDILFPNLFTSSEEGRGEGWVMGHSKIFFKDKYIKILEDARESKLKTSVLKIERLFRKILRRKKWRKVSKVLIDKHREEQRKKREEEERKRREEEERKRKEEEERKKKEEERKRKEEEERKRKEEEERRLEEKKRIEEEERKRKEEEEERRLEEQKKRIEEEKKREQELKQRGEEEQRAREEEKRLKDAEEQRLKEEEKQRKESEEAQQPPPDHQQEETPTINTREPEKETSPNVIGKLPMRGGSVRVPQSQTVPSPPPRGSKSTRLSNTMGGRFPSSTPHSSSSPVEPPKVSPRRVPVPQPSADSSNAPRKAVPPPVSSNENSVESTTEATSESSSNSNNNSNNNNASTNAAKSSPRGKLTARGSIHASMENLFANHESILHRTKGSQSISGDQPNLENVLNETSNDQPSVQSPSLNPNTNPNPNSNPSSNSNFNSNPFVTRGGMSNRAKGIGTASASNTPNTSPLLNRQPPNTPNTPNTPTPNSPTTPTPNSPNLRGRGRGMGRGMRGDLPSNPNENLTHSLSPSQISQSILPPVPQTPPPIPQTPPPIPQSIPPHPSTLFSSPNSPANNNVNNETARGGGTPPAGGVIDFRGRGRGRGGRGTPPAGRGGESPTPLPRNSPSLPPNNINNTNNNNNNTNITKLNNSINNNVNNNNNFGSEEKVGDNAHHPLMRGDAKGDLNNNPLKTSGRVNLSASLPTPLSHPRTETISRKQEPEDSLATIIAMQIPKLVFEYEGVEISKEEIHRRKVIYELLKTEKDYIDDIFLLIEIFTKPLIKSQILKMNVIQSIFCDVESLIKVNIQVLKLILNYSDSYVDTQDLPIGDIFLQTSSLFKAYSTYCINQPVAFSKIEELQDTHPQFVSFVKNCENDRRCRGLQLISFLIKPTQRIMKYPLLLKDIVNHTQPSHSDYTNLVEALKQITEVVDYINEKKRDVELAQEIDSLQNSIEGLDITLNDNPERKFMKEYSLFVTLKPKEKPQELSVFIFSDVVILGKKKKKGKKTDAGYEFRKRIDLTNSKFIVVAEIDTFHSFELKEGRDDEIRFSSLNNDEINELTRLLKPIINTYQRKKLLSSSNASAQ